MAAQSFFGKDVVVVPCATFREVVKLAGDAETVSAGLEDSGTGTPHRMDHSVSADYGAHRQGTRDIPPAAQRILSGFPL